MTTPVHRRGTLLLVEPESLQRRTVAAVARELQLADVQEATSVKAAAQLLAERRYEALFIALDHEGVALGLLSRVRGGESACDRGLPVAVIAEVCDTETALRLKQLDVRRLLLKPFKIKGVLEAIACLLPEGGASH